LTEEGVGRRGRFDELEDKAPVKTSIEFVRFDVKSLVIVVDLVIQTHALIDHLPQSAPHLAL
jgi:hypothetical protein